MSIRVTIWNEFKHELDEKHAASKLYPEGIHQAIAKALGTEVDFEIRTATLDQPEHGLTDEVLNQTDVLIWWGHKVHHEVSDAIVDKVINRVMCGMGFIALHSAHFSKPFIRLMGTTCTLKYRDANENERLWIIEPNHPIAKGLGEYIDIPCEEMYGERFDIPTPETLVMVGWFKGGEVFRSGCCYTRGLGKVFYFQPGHEAYPVYYQPEIQTVLKNAVRWAKAERIVDEVECVHVDKPLEQLV
ncbi:MAG: ThuA domain-containing protein [Hyphomonadaceae bacterium]|nr:ThuA domain-containing protein [Clostridia bacterium]